VTARQRAALYSLELEEGLLGSMMLSAEVCRKALAELTTDDFGDARTRCVFGVMAGIEGDVSTPRIVAAVREVWTGDPQEIVSYVLKLPDWVALPSEGHGLIADLLVRRRRRGLADASALLAKASESTEPEQLEALARALVAPDPLSNGWRKMTAAQLLAAAYEEPRWVVPDLLPEGLCVFAARPKTGKSWLSLQLGIALATGGKFLGRDLDRASVLILALEDGDRRLAKRLGALECPRSVEGLHFQFGIPPLTKGGMEYLTRLVEETDPALVVIDTLSRALEGRTDQDKNADMTAVLDPLQRMALAQHRAVMVIDHLRKPDGPLTEKNPVTEVMGSTAKVGVADTIWGLYRKKGERRGELTTTGRDLEDSELVLDFASMPAGWQLVGDASDVGRSAAQQRYLDALRELGPSDHTAVADFLEVSASAASEALRRLAESGRVNAVSQKRQNARPRIVYDLPTQRGSSYPGEVPPYNPDNLITGRASWDGPWWEEH
jgi:AAA domain